MAFRPNRYAACVPGGPSRPVTRGGTRKGNVKGSGSARYDTVEGTTLGFGVVDPGPALVADAMLLRLLGGTACEWHCDAGFLREDRCDAPATEVARE